VLQAVLDELDMRGPEGLESLRVMFSGGEALSGELRDRFMSRVRADLFNQYGPTEAAVDSTFARAGSDFASRVPIGRPISNKQVYLLDPHLQPVPIGVRAEIYIGGEGLAHGYTGQPGTTAERFVPDLFSKAAGRRLYRTGDLGRYLADGRIEFQGRTDHQVKVRGIRVELGEIEKVLGTHPALREVAVVAAPGESGCRLIAYGSANNGDAPMPDELYSFLQRRLPEYMIPSGFVLMESLPRSPGGKIDRPSLPDPASALSLSGSFVAPRTGLERKVAGVWVEVLGAQPIGVHDNFFRLGGHSLLGARLLARLSAMFGVDLTMVNLFAGPTIARLSESIDEMLLAKLQELTDEEAASLI
jgi:acyl-coenzyme A synthetase/AMP-(fatty) acid ligase